MPLPNDAPSSDASKNPPTEYAGAASPPAQPAVSLTAEHLDPLRLSALMASRLCHDLINPVGALSSGLEVLNDPAMDDEMHDDALELVKSSAEKAVALLKFARLAYGQSGGIAMDVPLDEARLALEGLFAWCKPSLEWRLAPDAAPKEQVKALLALAHAAADCVPRGGVVAIAGAPGEFKIEATGPRVFLNDDVARALRGEGDALQPKQAPLFLAGLAARRVGGALSASVDGERVVMNIVFDAAGAAQAAVRDAASALTQG